MLKRKNDKELLVLLAAERNYLIASGWVPLAIIGKRRSRTRWRDLSGDTNVALSQVEAVLAQRLRDAS